MKDMNMTSPALLISFVLDNSASVTGERLGELMRALRATDFGAAEVEIVTYGGLEPTLVKRFEEETIAPVKAGGFPLPGRAIAMAKERLCARANELKSAGNEVYRPWLFLLTDGFALDALEETVAALECAEREGELMYLPFKLSEGAVCDRLQVLDRSKHLIRINEGCIERFFDFVLHMIEQRAALPVEEGVKFSKSDFEGWATL